MDSKGMGQLIDSFYTFFPENHNHYCYLFLDEIQNIENWVLVARRLFDTKKIHLYLTAQKTGIQKKFISEAGGKYSLPFALQAILWKLEIDTII